MTDALKSAAGLDGVAQREAVTYFRYSRLTGKARDSAMGDFANGFCRGAEWQRQQDESEAAKVAGQRAVRIRELEAEVEDAQWATRVDPCEITHTEPYDFDQCLAHDRTLPRGGECDHAGKSAMDHETDLHMKQRGRAVRAEMRAETAEARLDKIRAEVLDPVPLGAPAARAIDKKMTRILAILDGGS